MQNADKAKRPRKLETCLGKGDTVFLPAGGRITIKRPGANGGRVKVSVTTDEGTAKVVKQRKG